jgi:hypothetical protein
LTRDTLEGEALRLIRRLSVRNTRLRLAGSGAYRIESDGRPASRESIAAEVAESLVASGVLVGDGGTLTLSDIGRARLRRSLAGAEGYRAQHQERDATSVVDEEGALRQVTVDRGESPLSWLRHRRGRDGRPLIEAVEFEAGERLRADFERGR